MMLACPKLRDDLAILLSGAAAEWYDGDSVTRHVTIVAEKSHVRCPCKT